ncbi:signal transduction histidine kinase [Cryobacterium mesophilum]|nr:histidine kinase [Terrimesophilobacter mesophilus]MBB5632221.1 signal transduction histidine kinase [Terrimesophilobacter mesophilus]
MLTWLEANAFAVAQATLIAVVVLVVLVIVLLVLLRKARRTRRAEAAARVHAERDAIDLELTGRELLARLRIVRELHDVAAHSISGIVTKAESVRHAATADPESPIRAAEAIGETARKALADLRRIGTVAREDQDDRLPQQRIDGVPDLLAVMRDAGLVIDLEESGEPFDLPKGAELAVYRVIEESLSNTLKHAGEGTHVTVSLTWRDEGLQVLVDDDGVRAALRRDGLDPNDAPPRQGTVDEDLGALTDVVTGPGISEMRERVELFGGVFTVYSVPGVGFSTSAVFPALRYDNGVHGVNLGGRRGEK